MLPGDITLVTKPVTSLQCSEGSSLEDWVEGRRLRRCPGRASSSSCSARSTFLWLNLDETWLCLPFRHLEEHGSNQVTTTSMATYITNSSDKSNSMDPNNLNSYNMNSNTSHNTRYDLAPSNGPSAPDSFHHSSGFSQNSNIPMTYTDSTNLAALDIGPATIDPATEYPMIAARMASSNSTPNLYTNEAMLQGFSDRILPDHKHWQRLSGQLKWLETLGVKHIWTPPATKASSLRTDGYDVYDLYDLGEFHQKGTIATKWGTKQEFQELARAASGHGIKLIFDAVLHHKAGADAYENVTFSRTMPWRSVPPK